MRAMPYLIENSAGVWCVQRKVPEKLQTAVARLLNSKKQTQKYLKKSLGTKDRREANRRAIHALADLDRTLREAEALTRQQPQKPKAPLRTINDTEIRRMAEYVYAKALAWDERTRYGRDELKRMEAEHIQLRGGEALTWHTPYDELPPYGLTPDMLAENREQLALDIKDFREYLALGDISAVEEYVNDALDAFHFDLDRKSAAYSKLGMEVLRTYMRGLLALEQRAAGWPAPPAPLGP